MLRCLGIELVPTIYVFIWVRSSEVKLGNFLLEDFLCQVALELHSVGQQSLGRERSWVQLDLLYSLEAK